MPNNNNSQEHTSSQTSPNHSELDLKQISDILFSNVRLLLTIVVVVLVIGYLHLKTTTPIYRTDALMQVESRPSLVPMADDLRSLFGRLTRAQAEIEVIRSRTTLEPVVIEENLHISATPKRLPIVGHKLSKLGLHTVIPQVLGYSLGGEHASINSFEVPSSRIDHRYILRPLSANTFALYLDEHTKLLEGELGKTATTVHDDQEISINVANLSSPGNTDFYLRRNSVYATLQQLQARLSLSENGLHSGIITMSLEGSDPRKITSILTGIATSHLRQSVERRSEEAQRMLQFLDEQLPIIKEQLDTAETNLRTYQQKEGGSVDLSIRGTSMLERATDIDSQLSRLELEISELSTRYTAAHPTMVTLLDQKKKLLAKKDDIAKQLESLPATELESIRLLRNVTVANEMYVQMLNRGQELRVSKAGTVSDTRVLDYPMVPNSPIKPKPILVMGISLMLGLFLGLVVVFLRVLLNRKIEGPNDIEDNFGIPVFATIPHSKNEAGILKSANSANNGSSPLLLSSSHPDDPSVESIRSLRASLHFAQLGAKNNLISIVGPTPSLGKTFVASNLAFLLSQLESRVLLLDTDLRKGQLNKRINGKAVPGLSDLLTNAAPLDEVIQHIEQSNLDFISTGKFPPNPTELLLNPNFSALLTTLSARYDYVVIDTPPILNLADAVTICKHVGTNLLLLRSHTSNYTDLDLAIKRFGQNGIPISGVVLNDLSKRTSKSQYGRYYNYKY